MGISMVSETDVQVQIAEYLRLQYPDVMFHSDFGGGARLTPGQAAKQKRQNGGRRAWPDMVIAELRTLPAMFCKGGRPFPLPKINADFVKEECDGLQTYAGLYLELKKDGERLLAVPGHRRMYHWLSKDGKEYKDEHLMEQADVLYELRNRGYCAEFAIGFDEAKRIIDEYLGGK